MLKIRSWGLKSDDSADLFSMWFSQWGWRWWRQSSGQVYDFNTSLPAGWRLWGRLCCVSRITPPALFQNVWYEKGENATQDQRHPWTDKGGAAVVFNEDADYVGADHAPQTAHHQWDADAHGAQVCWVQVHGGGWKMKGTRLRWLRLHRT